MCFRVQLERIELDVFVDLPAGLSIDFWH
jgi:hypothetical protein